MVNIGKYGDLRMTTFGEFLQTAMDLIQFLLCLWLFLMINKNENKIIDLYEKIGELDLYKLDDPKMTKVDQE